VRFLIGAGIIGGIHLLRVASDREARRIAAAVAARRDVAMVVLYILDPTTTWTRTPRRRCRQR